MEVVICDLYAQGWLIVGVLLLIVHQPEFFEDLRNLIKYFKVHQRFWKDLIVIVFLLQPLG